MVAVTPRLDRVQTSPVLVPLMFPERLIVPVCVDPVSLHVPEEIGAALRAQDVRDVAVGAAGVAGGSVGAVAVVGPGVLC